MQADILDVLCAVYIERQVCKHCMQCCPYFPPHPFLPSFFASIECCIGRAVSYNVLQIGEFRVVEQRVFVYVPLAAVSIDLMPISYATLPLSLFLFLSLCHMHDLLLICHVLIQCRTS